MAKTKALISLEVTAKLICVFVFAYANCWFSHAKAHIFVTTQEKCCQNNANLHVHKRIEIQIDFSFHWMMKNKQLSVFHHPV